MLIGVKNEARILQKESFFLSAEKYQQKVTMIGGFGEEVVRKSEHPPNLLFTVATGFFLRTNVAGGVNLTTRLYPLPRLRMSGAILLQLVLQGMHRHKVLSYRNYRPTVKSTFHERMF